MHSRFDRKVLRISSRGLECSTLIKHFQGEADDTLLNVPAYCGTVDVAGWY